MGFSFGNTDDNGDPAGAGQITTSTMTISPFARYYLDDKFFVSGGVSIGSGNVTTKMDNVDDVSVDVSTFGLNVGAGLSLMWGERVAIEPAFMVMTGSSNTKTGNTTVDGPSSMSAGFSIGLSLRMK